MAGWFIWCNFSVEIPLKTIFAMNRIRLYKENERSTWWRRILWALIITIIGVFIVWGLVKLMSDGRKSTGEAPDKIDEHLLKKAVMPKPSVEPPPAMAMELTLAKGESLGRLLARGGVDRTSISSIIESLLPFMDMRKLHAGQKVRLFFDPNTNMLTTMIMPIDRVKFIEVHNTPQGFKATLKSRPISSKRFSVACIIRYSFHKSLLRCGVDSKLTNKIETFLSERMDLFREIHRGDVLRLVGQKLLVSGKFLKYGHFMALSYNGKWINMKVYFFRGEYYLSDGELYERPFLATPVRYSKVYWGKATLNKEKKVKLNVQYQLPAQTPVYAVGDGKVIFSGKMPRLGRTVIIKHKYKVRTYYYNLGWILPQIRVGVFVKKGDMIAKVGKWPFKFAASLNGVYMNPNKLRNYTFGKRLEASVMEDFERFKKQWDKILSELPIRNGYTGPQ